MLIDIKVPQLSESVAEATLLAWHKKVGDRVDRDENLIDVETDKVVLELPAPQSGVIARIIKGDGGTVVSGEVIATIDTEGTAVAAAPAMPARTEPAAAPPAPKTAPSEDPRLMPAARKMAEESGVDTRDIPGTGRGGRITKGDIVQHLQTGKGAAAQPALEAVPAPAAEPARPALQSVSAPVKIEQILGDRPEQRVPM